MPDLACAAAAARTTPLAPIRPAISISTRVIRLLTTPILGSEVPGDFSRVNPLALLRARRDRPRDRRAAEQRDELAALHRCDHSISSSARASRRNSAHLISLDARRCYDVRPFLCLVTPELREVRRRADFRFCIEVCEACLNFRRS